MSIKCTLANCPNELVPKMQCCLFCDYNDVCDVICDTSEMTNEEYLLALCDWAENSDEDS